MSRKQRKLTAAAARNNNVACPGPTPAPTQTHERQEFRQIYLEKFQPTDQVELDLVEEMISAQWRQRSLALIEEAAFTQLMSSDVPDIAVAFEMKSKALSGIERSRKGFALQFSRALATLTKLRACAKVAKPCASATTPPETAEVPSSSGSTGNPGQGHDLADPPAHLDAVHLLHSDVERYGVKPDNFRHGSVPGL